jgi:hypothetical protein
LDSKFALIDTTRPAIGCKTYFEARMSKKRALNPSSQMKDIISYISSESASFTEGALEALCVSQVDFLQCLSRQLVTMDKGTYSRQDIAEALNLMGMNDIQQRAWELFGKLPSDDSKQASKQVKRKRGQWSQDLEDEQERLLRKSRNEVENQVHGES